MAKFLTRGSYTADGIKGVLEDGGTNRVQAAKQLIEGVGGKVKAFYFCFGDDDFIIVSGGPDYIGKLAISMIANATGAVKVKTTILFTPEEMDKATKMIAEYRPPGTYGKAWIE